MDAGAGRASNTSAVPPQTTEEDEVHMAETETHVRPEGHEVPGRAKLERYTDEAGVRRADSGPPQRPPRVAGPTHDAGDKRPVAEQDSFARDAAGIRRIVRQGDPIPPGFTLLDEDGEPVAATSAAEPDTSGQTAPSAAEPTGDGTEPQPVPEQPQQAYADRTVEELTAEVERRRAAGREIEVTGSGRRGAVKEGDLVAALEADDAAAAEQPQA